MDVDNSSTNIKMIDLSKAEHMLRVDEGVSPKPYRCGAGKLTIGVGHNLEAKGLPEDVITLLLDHDITDAYKCAWGFFGADVFNQWGGARRLAIINMIFNLGYGRFLEFKKMIRHIEMGEWDAAADEALDSAWARQVGERSKRVAHMLRTNEFIY